jgi:menaquinone-9 beta-reductase
VSAARVEVAVIGGGPAGAAAAALLAEAGREVLVIERAAAPGRKVCGEFLGPAAAAALARLGLDAVALGAAPMEEVRLTAAGRAASAPLPFRAAGLSRPALDAALLRRAAAAGAVIRRGAAVRAIAPAAGGVALRLGDGETVTARLAIVATGKSDVHGRERATPWPGREAMIGLKMHLRPGEAAARRLAGRIELHLFAGGCAGLQLIDGGANLCVTLSKRVYAACGAGFPALIEALGRENPEFAAAMEGARPLWPAPLAIARVPYGFLRQPRGGRALPLWHVGDQAAVTPSFTGDGLGMALQSGLAAADAILAGGGADAYEAAFADRAARQMRPAMALQALLDRPALHGLAVAAARLRPRLLTGLAARTRLPPRPVAARAA